MLDTLLNYAAYLFGNTLTNIFCVSCWTSCCEKSGDSIINNRTKTISIILLVIFTFVFNLLLPRPIRFTLTFILLIFTSYKYFTRDIKTSIILVITSQLIIWFSEFTFVIIASIFGIENIQELTNEPLIFILLNAYVTIISFVILMTKLPQKFFKLINKSTNNIKLNETVMYSIIIIVVIVVSTTESYMQLPLPIILTTNVIMAIIFIGLIIMSSTIKSKYNNINSKYETSITSLREYEGMIDKYRIYNHENKNELQTLRNLISKKNTKALKYIDEIINDKIKDNEKIMYKTSKIPEGGLRATIYSKLCTMDELGIKYSLDIAKDIRTVDLINMKEDIVLNICKILGVFLDNAIEAVKDLKTKHIGIEIYLMDGDLCVDITNNYEGKLDMNKIGSSKYTTKGGNHGYGLSLVNQIISDYPDRFENEKSITKNTFTQKIKIKM